MSETREARPASNGTGHNTQLTGGDSTTDGTAFAAALRRRRAVSWRCVPLPDGRRDPLDPVDEDWITDSELDSWLAAIAHLNALGYRPIVPADVAAQLAVAS